MMDNLKWSDSEKKLARRIFDAVLEAELAEIMSEFKSKAAVATTPGDMWAVQEFLARRQREIDEKFDHRYSKILFVFGRLVREGRLQEERLHGLSEEKLSFIRQLARL